jgi:signal peptidase I
MALVFPFMALLVAKMRLFMYFWGLVATVALAIWWRFFIIGDAAYCAWKGARKELFLKNRWFVFSSIGAIIVLADFLPTPRYYLNHTVPYFRAFRTPSASMCPTICNGDRIVADMDAYLKTAPQRGDLIMFDFQTKHGPLFIKRIIGVGGDTVSEKDGTILINGNPLARGASSQVCGKRTGESSPTEALPQFERVTVPPASFFVVGDNSANSYDSRIPGFEFVTSDQVKGRPVYIYWSPDRSRIGCAIR